VNSWGFTEIPNKNVKKERKRNSFTHGVATSSLKELIEKDFLPSRSNGNFKKLVSALLTEEKRKRINQEDKIM